MILLRDERLVEFSFSSQIAEDVSRAAVMRLVQQSWRDNHRMGVTGVMRHAGSSIEQSIEGPSGAVLALSARILTDRRHGQIVVRSFGPIAERRFAGWSVEGLEAPAPAPQGARGSLRLLVCGDVPLVAIGPRQPAALAVAT
jgi:hypothetical protein